MRAAQPGIVAGLQCQVHAKGPMVDRAPTGRRVSSGSVSTPVNTDRGAHTGDVQGSALPRLDAGQLSRACAMCCGPSPAGPVSCHCKPHRTPAMARAASKPWQCMPIAAGRPTGAASCPADQRRRQRARRSPAPAHGEFLRHYAPVSRPPWHHFRTVTKKHRLPVTLCHGSVTPQLLAGHTPPATAWVHPQVRPNHSGPATSAPPKRLLHPDHPLHYQLHIVQASIR